jgi:hypothetical protein
MSHFMPLITAKTNFENIHLYLIEWPDPIQSNQPQPKSHTFNTRVDQFWQLLFINNRQTPTPHPRQVGPRKCKNNYFISN